MFDQSKDIERYVKKLPAALLPVHRVMLLSLVFGVIVSNQSDSRVLTLFIISFFFHLWKYIFVPLLLPSLPLSVVLCQLPVQRVAGEDQCSGGQHHQCYVRYLRHDLGWSALSLCDRQWQVHHPKMSGDSVEASSMTLGIHTRVQRCVCVCECVKRERAYTVWLPFSGFSRGGVCG